MSRDPSAARRRPATVAPVTRTTLSTLRIALVLATVALGACGERRTASGSAPPRAAATPPPVEVAAPPEPPPETLPDARVVRLTTEDGYQIVGTLQPAASPDAGAVVLVHQLGSDRSEWAPLLERLHGERALTTLAIDLRGHGESTAGPDGIVAYGAFDAEGWTATANDVRAAVAYLFSEESGVRPAHVAAVGASIGSSAVIAAAAVEPRIEHLVALSPGRAYHGFDAITPAIGLGDRSYLGVVAAEETDNVETASALGRVMHHEPIVVPGTAHGVAIFSADPTTLDRVEQFLREALTAPRRSPPGASATMAAGASTESSPTAGATSVPSAPSEAPTAAAP